MSDLKNYFNDIIKLNPSFGSFLGYRKYDGDYENSLSPTYRKKYKTLLQKYKNTKDKVLRYEVKIGLDGLKYKFYLIPLSSHNNEIINFTFFNQTSYPLKTERDYENLVRRHEIFMEYIDSGIANMREGMKCGMVLPKLICEKMIAGIDTFYKKKGYIIEVPKKYEYIFEKYSLKIKELIEFLKGEYLKKCMAGVGVCDLPNGKKMYRYLVRSQTTTNRTPEDIYAFGLKEVSRIKVNSKN